MKFRQPASRRAAWTLWVCVLALLLKVAMPMLASVSAQVQGRALVEICTVYGVASVAGEASLASDRAGDAGANNSANNSGNDSDSTTHRPQHCALTALLAWSAPEPQALRWRIAPRVPDQRVTWQRAPLRTHAADACAAWVAQLRHGPPTHA